MGGGWRSILAAAWVVVALEALAIGQPPQDPKVPAPAAKTLAAFTDAFNKHDAQAVAALWTTDATHESAATGEKKSGRESIAKAYAELFQAEPKIEINLQLVPAKVADDHAELAGLLQVRHAAGAVTTSHVEARLVATPEGWRIASVRETVLPPSAPEALAQLEWLVGRWIDESDGSRVTNEIDWARGRHFLTRSYRQEKEGKVVREGTQIIGWDAEDHCLRCWTFDNDGSFGEGVVEPDGQGAWLARLVLKLPDGRRGSLVQKLERTDDGQLQVQTVSGDIDGETLPQSPIAKLHKAK